MPHHAPVGGTRNTFVHKSKLRVIVHQPVLAGQHQTFAALCAGVCNSLPQKRFRIAAAAAARERVYAKDHLPGTGFVVQSSVGVHFIRQVGRVRAEAVHKSGQFPVLEQQPEMVCIVCQPAGKFLCRGRLCRREAFGFHRRDGGQIF